MDDRSSSNRGSSPVGNEDSQTGIQPRIVLVLLLAASFAGTWLARWGRSPVLRLIWWIVVISDSILVGGLYWRLVLFDPSSFEDSNTARWIRARWRRLETLAVWSFALCAAVGLFIDASNASFGIGVLVFATGALFAPVLWVGIYRSAASDGSRRRSPRPLLFVLAVLSLGSFAWMETGTGFVGWVVRFGHVTSFALWIGGAFWHNFLLLPVVGSPTAANAVKRQARRFRRHLPVVVLVLFVTGGYQALRLVEPSPSALLDSSIGRLIGVKLLVLLVLSGLVIVNLGRAASSH